MTRPALIDEDAMERWLAKLLADPPPFTAAQRDLLRRVLRPTTVTTPSAGPAAHTPTRRRNAA